MTLRVAGPADAGALRRLAQRDCADQPAAPLLVAEVDDVLLAARSPRSGVAVADPFAPTAHLLALLALHARALSGSPPPTARRRPTRIPTPSRLGLRAA